ncbi:MAG: GNAT family N-acetyltransferase [Pseudomonadota bacterium]
MTDPRCTQAPTGSAAQAAARLADLVPGAKGNRVRLRAPRLADLPAWTEIFAQWPSGPYTAETAYEQFCTYVAGWLLHGHGLWSVDRLSDGELLGFVHLGLEWDDVEPELGWMFRPEHRGEGYATEAAALARAHGTSLLGAGGFVSYVAADNAPSNALAQRLGAQRDPDAEATIGEPDLHVWRHGVRP